MFNYIKGAVSSVKGKAAVAVMGVSIAAGAAQAAPPAFPDISLYFEEASYITKMSAAGGVMLATWATVYVGFKLARKLIRRTSSAV